MYIAIDADGGNVLSQSEDGESFGDFCARFVENELQYLDCRLTDMQFAAIIPHKLSITREVD